MRTWLWPTLALIFCAGFVLSGVWIADDALVALCSARNLAEGAGLGWNPGERMLVHGNPLWIVVLALGYAVTHSVHHLPIIAAGFFSLIALLILWRRVVREPTMAALAIFALACSQAFTAYAASGLENALGHVFMALFLAEYLRAPGSGRRIVWLALLATGGILSQYESAFIYLPALLHAGRGRASLWLGLSPLLLWLLFALWYFGFPLPNAAYARMHAGLSLGQLTALGLGYLQASDWVTLVLIVGGLAATVRPIGRPYAGLGWGLALYLVFVVLSGATDASQRLLTLPLFGAVALLAVILRPRRPVKIVALVLLLGLRFLPGPASDRPWVAAIDERRFIPPIGATAADVWVGARAISGDRVIDAHGAADLLMAQLPAAAFDARLMIPPNEGGGWRTGRFLRVIPRGYLESVRSGGNQLSDPLLARCYDDLLRIARGSLRDSERWRTIWRLNTSRELQELDPAIYREPVVIPIFDIESERKHGTAMERARAGVRGADTRRIAYALSFTGLRVELPSPTRAGRVRVGLEEAHDYLLAFYAGETTLGCQSVAVGAVPSGRMARTDVTVPPEVRARGFDAVGIFPVSGEGITLVGPLDVVD